MQFRGIIVGIIEIYFLKYLSNHLHFVTNGFETLFIDQLAQSKATFPFNFGFTFQSSVIQVREYDFISERNISHKKNVLAWTLS